MNQDQTPPSPERVWNAVKSYVQREAKKYETRQLTIYPIPSSSIGINTSDYPRVSICIEMDRGTRGMTFEASVQHSLDAPARMHKGFFVPTGNSPWIYESRTGETLRLDEIICMIFGLIGGN
jgi:hypothetical protein